MARVGGCFAVTRKMADLAARGAESACDGPLEGRRPRALLIKDLMAIEGVVEPTIQPDFALRNWELAFPIL
mgnify:CR=1 FL=1